MKRLLALLCKAMVAPTKADLHVPVKYGWPRLKVKDLVVATNKSSCGSHLRLYDIAC